MSKRTTQRRWPEVSSAKVEQDVMLAAYSMRKLVEAAKLSDAVRDSQVPMQAYAFTGKGRLTLMNWHHLERFYELGKPVAGTIAVKDLCNQLIHSYVFAPIVGPGGLEAFYVTSDRDRRKLLREIAIGDFIGLLRTVGQDSPDNLKMTWNPEKMDFDVTAH
jgi:hypothetical protein